MVVIVKKISVLLIGFLSCTHCVYTYAAENSDENKGDHNKENAIKTSWTIGGFVSHIERETIEDDEVNIAMVPLTLKWRAGLRWLKVSTAWIAVEGSGHIDDALSSDTLENREEQGVGDSSIAIGQLFSNKIGQQPFWTELSGKVKIPTADEEKGLGTGETDVTVTGSLFYLLQGRGTGTSGGWKQWYGRAAYQWRGDPETIDLNDRWIGTVGGVGTLTEQIDWGVQWQWQDRAVETLDPKQSLFIYCAWALAQGKHSTAWIKKITPFLLTRSDKPSRELGVGVNISGDW